tara:strand:+ start:82 stop:276 length:195 start_codon:yes stop_codon:yes gene_type:complete
MFVLEVEMEMIQLLHQVHQSLYAQLAVELVVITLVDLLIPQDQEHLEVPVEVWEQIFLDQPDHL